MLEQALPFLFLLAAPYDVVLHEEVRIVGMVPMRDGVRLATDIYRPARRGVSSSTSRSPSCCTARLTTKSGECCRVGRVFRAPKLRLVVQDARGRYASEGVFTKIYRAKARRSNCVGERLRHR